MKETRLDDTRVTSGGHCESSAILNALRFLGYPFSECMIAGAGGALDFTFPKGTFPFVGARNRDMRERFFDASGIKWHLCPPDTEKTPDAGWAEIRALLESGIPVILRVDMRYLPYRYKGRYGSAWTSFGWHMITLFGIDHERGTAFVSDTEFPRVQEIALADLRRARTSRTRVFPPHAEYYWVEKAPDGCRADWPALVRHSLAAVTANYEKGALEALSRYGSDLANLEGWSRQKFLIPAVLEYMAGNIEDFGTGGAAFRKLYRDFLAGAYAQQDGSGMHAGLALVLPLADAAVEAWHELAAGFRSLSPKIGKMGKRERQDAYAALGILGETVGKRENLLYTGLKRLQGEI